MFYEGAQGFTTQFTFASYEADQAVLDVMVLRTNDITSPFNVTNDGLIRAYMSSCELVSLTVPSMPYNFKHVLANLNNPSAKQWRH